MMCRFTPNTKYSDIIHDPMFKGWEFMLDFQRSDFSQEIEEMSLLEMEQKMEWNAEIMVEGASYLYESQMHRNVFHSIWEDHTPETGKEMTGLVAFTLREPSRFVLICPGGGYSAVCCLLEGYSLAKKLNEMGYAAFVLSYRVEEKGQQPHPQEDVAQAVRYILQHKDQFDIVADDYAVIGFSAGAHVAGCYGTNELGYAHYDLPKPAMIVLGYPVITMTEYTHPSSRENLFGISNANDPKLIEKYSIEKHVTPAYPPTFLWQCEGDPMVPFQNSVLMYDALVQAGVPHVYEVYPYNEHGLPNGATQYERDWVNRAVDFWKHQIEQDNAN